jgi:DNA-binding ferritin-like protein
MLSQVDDETEILDQNSMFMELAQDNEKMIKLFKMVYDAAEQYSEHGFSNFLAERMDAHRKHGWMLKASMQS